MEIMGMLEAAGALDTGVCPINAASCCREATVNFIDYVVYSDYFSFSGGQLSAGAPMPTSINDPHLDKTALVCAIDPAGSSSPSIVRMLGMLLDAGADAASSVR